jgi:hypothetical protein
MRIPDYSVSQFSGLNTVIRDTKALKPGVATDSKNWLTAKYGDHIELRRGSALLGATRVSGAGKITGLGVGTRYDGVQVPFWSRGRKFEYYDDVADDRVEIGSNILPAVADGEDCWFSPYQNLAGSMMYGGSRNGGTFKIPVANPGSAVDQQTGSFNFGFLRFGQGRALAGRRKGSTAGNQDDTGLYLSDIDKALLSSFSQTTGESYGTGDGSAKTFAHTLAAVTGKKTCMYPSVTDGVETFTDDRNGNMVGSLGGTGTINYATGAVSITFNTAPLNLAAVTCSYYTEDATSDGPLDFDTTSLGAGKAKIFRQDDGGAFMAVLPFMDVNYAFHLLKTWALTTTIDDTAATNLPYRSIGIPNSRAVKETPDGILCIDVSNPNEPKVRRLQIQQNTNNLTIVPASISDALDLSGYAFDYAVAFRWGDYEIVCCQEYVNGAANTYNSVMFVHNVFSGAWDRLDFGASCLAELTGSLIAGSPISNNVMTLFSGFDDDESPIDNYWQDGQLNLGTDNLKVAHRMVVKGLIQRDQAIGVYLILDDGTPVHVFTIEGDGDYVDSGINTSIGSYTIGSKVIGGGGEATAHPFEVDFPIHTDKFERISVRFEALRIGHAAINSYTYKDVRDKGRRTLPVKTV